MLNPYASPSTEPTVGGVFADHARLLSSAFLYREIEFVLPGPFLLVYSGWWFWQRIKVSDERVWSQISWLNLSRDIEFELPAKFCHSRKANQPDQQEFSDQAVRTDRSQPVTTSPQETSPQSVASNFASATVQGRIEINFGRALRIRRFRVWFDGIIAYDEIN